MPTSPAVVVTEAPADFDQPVATPPSVPNTGGDTVISGNTSAPDGTVLHLFVGTTDTGLTATAAGGKYSFPAYSIPTNTTLSSVQDSFTVQF